MEAEALHRPSLLPWFPQSITESRPVMESDPAERLVDPSSNPLRYPVDHVGIAVHSIEEAAALFENLTGERASPRQSLPDLGIDVCFVGAVELLEPHDRGGAVARFLEAGGSNLHHVAFRVEDVRVELDRLTAAGFRPIDRVPRPGAHGGLVAFLHPKGTGGALVELVERARPLNAP